MSEFLSENFQFLVVKFSIYLNRHVFVMIIFVTKQKKHLEDFKTDSQTVRLILQLRRLNTLTMFSANFYKGDNFCDFCLLFYTPRLFRKGVYSFLLQYGSTVFSSVAK